MIPPYAIADAALFFGQVTRSEFAPRLRESALNCASVTRRLPNLTAGNQAIVAALAANRLGELSGGDDAR